MNTTLSPFQEPSLPIPVLSPAPVTELQGQTNMASSPFAIRVHFADDVEAPSHLVRQSQAGFMPAASVNKRSMSLSRLDDLAKKPKLSLTIDPHPPTPFPHTTVFEVPPNNTASSLDEHDSTNTSIASSPLRANEGAPTGSIVRDAARVETALFELIRELHWLQSELQRVDPIRGDTELMLGRCQRSLQLCHNIRLSFTYVNCSRAEHRDAARQELIDELVPHLDRLLETICGQPSSGTV
ncbi:hypothetical protein BAUCODRAFT_33023 [Baudoinia panamericana UAMH 10762]|uniref:Uncharacterized protein n=1 Tax=Baudoinia panamericana (strain UAMH 10762) TaxID=717646 RepID=M2MKS6_BAUPA|nr:uncharacterized protein BAUCODRAFT_33023 [Baudoinia panamericana UAMH 10762]EMC97296.1 hypothetical protein BAUCODRAFT_33023 [Baudoinia panamericana UAMH 10762]